MLSRRFGCCQGPASLPARDDRPRPGVLRYGRLRPRPDAPAAKGRPLALSAPWFDETELARVREALAGRTSGDGPFGRRVEARLAELLGVPRVLLTTSCTHALELGLLALGIGQAAVQEQVRHFLERGVRRQIFDRVARQRQPAAVAVDFAESRRSRHHAFQAVCHSSMFDPRPDIVNIDRRINQWRLGHPIT